jgi:hypothetical protein
MNGFIGLTDNDWFAFLSQQPGIDGVNFWQPGGTGPPEERRAGVQISPFGIFRYQTRLFPNSDSSHQVHTAI